MANLNLIFLLFTYVIVSSATTVFADPPTEADCTNDTPFLDPENCTTYYQCFMIDTGWYLAHLDCPTGGYWDDVNKACIEGTCAVPTTTTTEPTTISTISTTPSTTTTLSTTTTTGTTLTPSPNTTPTPSTSGSTTGTSVGTTPTSGPPTFQCSAAGLFPHPTDPTKYYQCVLIGGQFYYYIFTCPPNACFQASAGMCMIGTCPSTTTAVTTTTPTTTTLAPEPAHPCPYEGYFGDPDDCGSYYRCILINGHMYRYMYRCPVGSYWNGNLQGCILGPCPTVKKLADTTTTTTIAPTTIESTTPAQISCTAPGFFPHPSKCTSYYQCVLRSGRYYFYVYNCPPFSKFDATRKICVPGIC